MQTVTEKQKYLLIDVRINSVGQFGATCTVAHFRILSYAARLGYVVGIVGIHGDGQTERLGRILAGVFASSPVVRSFRTAAAQTGLESVDDLSA